MATSGTTSFSYSFDDIFLLAIAEAGGDTSNADELRRAKQQMDLLLLDMSNRNILLHKLDEVIVTCSVSQGSYQLDLNVQDVYRANIVHNNRDLKLNRDSIETFFAIPNKLQSGRPTSFYVDRDLLGCNLHVWPLPSLQYQIRLKVHTLPENVGAAANSLDIPPRYVPAVVAMLAHKIASVRPGTDPNLIVRLKLEAEEKLQTAFGEDRDRASTYLLPGG